MNPNNTHDILADRLNSEPLIFRGCSNSELGMILLCAVLFWVPVSLMIAASFGAVAMGLGLSGLGILATVYVGATLFQLVKRGRPDNYYQHLMMIRLNGLGLWRSRLIRRHGSWSLGRSFLTVN
jgi:conjugative transfer region protein (TIGR03750 family)